MAIRSFGIHCCPGTHVVAANRFFALMENEDPVESQSFSIPCNASGSIEDDATHYVGGQFYENQLDKLARYQRGFTDEQDNLPEPPGGWPWIVNGQEWLTEAEMLAAIEAITITVHTAESQTGSGMPDACMLAVTTLHGIQRIVEPIEC